jgi:hypothetical protein
MLAESVGVTGGHQTLKIYNTTLVDVRLNNFRKLMTVPPTYIVSLIADELLQDNGIRRSTFLLLVVRNKFSMYTIEIDVRTSRTMCTVQRWDVISSGRLGSAMGKIELARNHIAGCFLSYLCNKLYREQMRRGHIGIDRSLKPLVKALQHHRERKEIRKK